jgi:PqqD family protein of HPr-rel-A system
MGHSPTWRVPSDSVFHWRNWDDEFVVYHENSGDTHRLNALGAGALRQLCDRPCSAPELVTRLALEFGVPADASLHATVDTLLTELQDLGLVESGPDAGPAA